MKSFYRTFVLFFLLNLLISQSATAQNPCKFVWLSDNNGMMSDIKFGLGAAFAVDPNPVKFKLVIKNSPFAAGTQYKYHLVVNCRSSDHSMGDSIFFNAEDIFDKRTSSTNFNYITAYTTNTTTITLPSIPKNIKYIDVSIQMITVQRNGKETTCPCTQTHEITVDK